MKKILLIEDNKDMRENTAEILELADYHVTTARNGKEGIEAALENTPDLIICDIMMPVLDGYGVLHALSKNPATSGIPFIFLTAKAERNEVRKGMEMGADDYLTKPFDDIELLNAIETRLKKMDVLKKEFSKDVEGLNDFIRTSGLEELKKLTDDQEIKNYPKHALIYREGAYPRGIYFLNKGKVKTFKSHEIGRNFIVSVHSNGEFFGYQSLLEESKYSDNAETLEDSEIVFIPKESFFSLVFKNAQVSRKFIKMLSNNLAEREDQLVRLAYNSVRKRVAEALVMLYDRYRQNDEKDIAMSIYREDLAGIVGTAKETLIRTLGDFKEENLIETEDRAIRIKNYEKLAHMRN